MKRIYASRWLWAAIGLAALFTVLLVPLPAWSTRAGAELENAGHAPLFAAVALGAWACFRRTMGAAAPLRAFVLAAIVTVVLSFATEFVQPLTGRDESLQDVLTDLLGATAGLSALAAWRVVHRTGQKAALVLLALLALGIVSWPLVEATRAYRHRQAIAPRLLDPDAAVGRYFLQRRAIRFAPDPDGGWRVTPARSQWPGLTVDEVLPDWSAYRALAIEVRNPGDRPLTLLLRIDDEYAHRRYSDRYNGSITLAPHQRSTWRIPLARLSHRTAGRNLELTHMRRVILYQDSPGLADPYVLHDLRLEP